MRGLYGRWLVFKLRAGLMMSRHHTAWPLEWLLPPQPAAAARVTAFVTLAHQGRVSAATLYHIRAWAEAGFVPLVLIVSDQPVAPEAIERIGSVHPAAGVAVRANRGYDFAAWASLIWSQQRLAESECLVIVNDSIIGPLDGFEAAIAAMLDHPAEVVGLTESLEQERHLQSYCVMFKNAALRSRAFHRFWNSIRTGGRDAVIDGYELRLTCAMEAGGLRCAAVFPAIDADNPTLTRWRELIEAGFPYIKAQLLRSNPYGVSLEGWREEMCRHGFDPALAESVLDRRTGAGAAAIDLAEMPGLSGEAFASLVAPPSRDGQSRGSA